MTDYQWRIFQTWVVSAVLLALAFGLYRMTIPPAPSHCVKTEITSGFLEEGQTVCAKWAPGK